MSCAHSYSELSLAWDQQRPLASTWTVTSTADDGSSGTLRYAITSARAPGDSINFNLPNPSTILLTASPQINITKNLSITGPGASQLSIDANVAVLGNDVFDIGGGAQVTISWTHFAERVRRGLRLWSGNNSQPLRGHGTQLLGPGSL